MMKEEKNLISIGYKIKLMLNLFFVRNWCKNMSINQK